MIRAALIVIALAFAGCAATGSVLPPALGGTSASQDREALSRSLDALHEGFEQGRIYRVLSQISGAYNDDEGRDYKALRADLKELFSSYRRIRVTRTHPRLKLTGDRATAVETVGIIAEPYNMDTHAPVNIYGGVTLEYARHDDGRWAVVSMSRQKDGSGG